ncbi:hypothetical protein GUJ93_ZPchr0005g15801 [Zizania palustris]|uniref:Uncharacterized protein n=1 Tax=Zizania palustris TaxID=103762 RepID=A0A8J5VQH1_ZIZPA|nr:hypothetical protein GUJ93_ZPchr0005g15801 [Zizania palustris]
MACGVCGWVCGGSRGHGRGRAAAHGATARGGRRRTRSCRGHAVARGPRPGAGDDSWGCCRGRQLTLASWASDRRPAAGVPSTASQ